MENPSYTHEKQTKDMDERASATTDQLMMKRHNRPQRRAQASTETEDEEDEILSLVNDDDSEGEYVDKYFQTCRKPRDVGEKAVEMFDSDEDTPVITRRDQEGIEILDADEYTLDVDLNLEDLDTETIIEIARARPPAPQPLLPIRPRRNAFSRRAPYGFGSQCRQRITTLAVDVHEDNGNATHQQAAATSSNTNPPVLYYESQILEDDGNESDCVEVVGSGSTNLICLFCDKNPDTEPPFSTLITLNTGDERKCPKCSSTGKTLEPCTKRRIRTCWVPEGQGPVRLYCRRCKDQEILKTGQRTKCTHCCRVLDWEADRKQEWFWEAIFGKEAKKKLEEWNDVLIEARDEDLGGALVVLG
jgi:hypothetical protein